MPYSSPFTIIPSPLPLLLLLLQAHEKDLHTLTIWTVSPLVLLRRMVSPMALLAMRIQAMLSPSLPLSLPPCLHRTSTHIKSRKASADLVVDFLFLSRWKQREWDVSRWQQFTNDGVNPTLQSSSLFVFWGSNIFWLCRKQSILRRKDQWNWAKHAAIRSQFSCTLWSYEVQYIFKHGHTAWVITFNSL